MAKYSMPDARIPAQYVLILIDLVESRGHDRGPLLAGTGLEAAGSNGLGARVSEEDFITLVDHAMTITGDPALGLEMGLRMNLSAHAILGQAFMTCRDLGQVMELFMKDYHLLAADLQLDMALTPTRCRLTVLNATEASPQWFFYELLFASIDNTLRGLLNRSQLPLSFEFPYPAPPHSDRYREAFGDAVRFDREVAAVSFPADLLASSVPSSNPALKQLYEQECARLLADREDSQTVSEQTLRLMRKFEGQYPQMPRLAQMLNLSPRTYRRRLAGENASYQALLDQIRAEHATRYLKTTRLPLAAIADRVGFNDASNFRRAYRRWTGRTPGQVRREQ